MAAITNYSGVQRQRTSFMSEMTPKCYRCGLSVYQAEKIGPVNDVIFHQACFKCAHCQQHLNLNSFKANPRDSDDHEVYCASHVPKTSVSGLDSGAVGIRRALTAQGLQRKDTKQAGTTPAIDANALGIKGMMISQGNKEASDNADVKASGPKIDSGALYIRGPQHAQSLLKHKSDSMDKHQYPAYVFRKKEKLIQAQKQLENELRKEEDQMYERFAEERKQIDTEVEKETEEEWEIKLKELTAKFDKDMAKKSKKTDKKVMTMQFENQKKELEKSLANKKNSKKKHATLRLVEIEQRQTAEMISKHSQQMLDMIASKQQQIKIEIEDEIRQNKEDDGDGEPIEISVEELLVPLGIDVHASTELPPPHPPRYTKRDLYHSATVFEQLDEYVFNIAEEDQATWTDLVHQLIAPCLTDLEKARAIFRWITVKDLNVLDFMDSANKDTPMGLLRGIKFGTETYHTLFMRLCSFAGLHCVEIKGRSKSVGYEPGMKFKEDTFQNTWNSVLIDGEWRLVQCNWGARHLVLNKDQKPVPEPQQDKKKRDKIRYQYDEHYFLTDPEEFIQEFMSSEEPWQLLNKPISLETFEDLPFVRSVFFHFGMRFVENYKAVLRTDNKGGVEVRIKIPQENARDVVFHYQLRFASKEYRNEIDYKGAKLDRFVFQSMIENTVIYSVHVPVVGDYFLEIFANRIDESHKMADEGAAPMMPFRLKCACKFKIVCDKLENKMHPLPSCAAGEWGPVKAMRHFKLKPLTHSTGVINKEDSVEIRFLIAKPLFFLIKLRMNGVDELLLEPFIRFKVSGDQLVIKADFPQPGQYGIDIYARPEKSAENNTLAHACKYLVNVDSVSKPVDLGVARAEFATSVMAKEKWGPTSALEKMGMRPTSHKDPKIKLYDANTVDIEFTVPPKLQVSYHLLREPDEDYRDNATVHREEETKLKFSLCLSKPGVYLLAVYARPSSDKSTSMSNVYNYMIKFDPNAAPEGKASLKKKSFFKK